MKINRVFTKPVIYILLIILGASTNRAFAFFKESSDSFRYEGYIKSANDNVAGVNINVYIDNNKVAITTSSRQGGFHLYLQHNKTYIIEFVKKDYITEKIQLETKISDEELKKGGIELSTDNEIEIFEYFTGMKINIFDNPVLYYYFNTKTFLIEEDLKKSKTAQLNTIRSSVTTSKNKLATAELKNAEALFKKQKYEEALVSYSLVLEYSPDNQTALDKLKEVKKILKKVPDFENNYKAIVQKADGFFNSKNYSDAKDNYKKAKAMKPDDPYPANKLYILDSIVTKNYVLNKKEYEKLIISADQEYKDKKYEDAQKGYESALALQVDIKYPQKQINAIKIAVAAEKKKKDDDAKAIEEKYKSLIKKGDDYMSKNDFANASAIYKQALELKPEDSYANSQKGKADKSLTEAAIEKLKTQKDKNYYDTIALGDKALKSKDNNLALTMYSAALGIKPSEKYPAKKIKEINRLLVSTINETEKQVANKPIMKPNEKQKAEKLDSGKVTGTYIKELQSEAENQEKSGNIEAASKTNMNIADFFREKDQFGKALYFLNKTFSLLKKKGDKAGESKVLNDIATVFYDSGQYKQTVSAYKEALALKKELGDVKGQAEVLSEMGNVLENTYQYETATDALNEVLVIRQQMGDNEGVSEVCNKLGGIYYSQNDYNKSILFFNKSLTIAESSNNKDSKGSLLNSLGVVYYKMGKFEEAIKFYNKSISVDKESGNNKNMSLSFNNIGNINFDWSKYEKAIEYYQRSLVLKRQLNFEQGMAVSMFNIGNSYLELKNFLKANEFLSSGLELAKKINFREVMQLSYKALSKLYENTGNFRSAMYASNSLIAILGPGGIIEGQISEMTEMYERESKLVKSLRHELERQKFLTDYQAMQTLQKQKEIQFKDLELKNQKSKTMKQRILLVFTLICLCFAGMLALQYYRRYQEKKHYSDVIGLQKQQITDSISYASRIQKAVCVPGEFMKSVFPESFIFNRPKDIVSGDYFYMTAKGEKVYFAVADCTGHGVPGAFMSMLGISLIKEVINQDKELLANEVLDELREVLIKALHQTGQDDETKDGMDIALCVIDYSQLQLEYSGANNSCYIIRENQFIELKADRMPIGIHPVIKPFTIKPMKLEKGDVIYLSSDGFRDQIGGDSKKKFKEANFHEMLIKIHSQPLDKQPEILEKIHVDWRSDMEQTDDILIVGIKV